MLRDVFRVAFGRQSLQELWPRSFPPPDRPRIRKKTPSGKCVVFFCPLRFPTTSARRHLEKSRREKSCARVRGFADFYQRFFRCGRSSTSNSAPIEFDEPCRAALRMWGGKGRVLVSRQIVDERPAMPVTSHHEAGRHVLAEQRNILGMQAVTHSQAAAGVVAVC